MILITRRLFKNFQIIYELIGKTYQILTFLKEKENQIVFHFKFHEFWSEIDLKIKFILILFIFGFLYIVR